MMKHLHTSLRCVILLLVLSCDKSENPAGGGGTGSTSDANHFSCYVNGEYWEAEAPFSIGGPVALYGEYNEIDGSGYLSATRKILNDSIFENIKLYYTDVLDTGQYFIYLVSNTKTGYINYYSLTCYKYYHDSLNPGTIKVTEIDKNRRVLRALFSMQLKNTSCGSDSILHITNGTFTFNY